MKINLGWLAIWVATGLALLVAAYLLINTTFMMYDDEGYILLTFRNFITGGRLYDEIFSQYGPWPYVYHLGMGFVLQTPITHMVGRNLTAVHWVLCSMLVGAIAARLTGEKVYALITTLVTFGLLWQMNSEPSHPGSLICVLLAAGTLLAVWAHERGRWNFLGATIGLVGGLLALTKINVGIFFLAGAGVAALRLTAWPKRWQLSASILAIAGLLLMPWGLMSGNLREYWVWTLAVQFTLCAAGLIWVTPIAPAERRISPRTWIVSVAVFIGTVLAVTAVVCARGTTLPALIESVLVHPLRHPSRFVIGFTWQPAVWPVAVVCWMLAARAGWELRYQGMLAPTTRLALLAVRLAVMGLFIVYFQEWMSLRGINRFSVYCLPLLPIFLVPLQGLRPVGSAVAAQQPLWSACIALPQVLHLYPVAGSQMGWGTFLMLPIVVVGLHDAWIYMAESFPRGGARLPKVARIVLLLVGGAQFAVLLHTGLSRYQTSKPFDLPGAEDIRAGDRARLIVRVLTLNAKVHANVLFSRQGMFSYNLWSGVPTPTAQNATHWFWLLDPPAQTGIIDRLRQTPRSAIITSQALDKFLIDHNVPMACPLQSFLEEHYRSLFELDGYNFHVPHDSHAAPFGRVDVLYPSENSGATVAAMLQTNVALDGNLASAQLQEIDSPWRVRAPYSRQNARLILQRITAAGAYVGQPIELPLPHPVRGLFQLKIFAATAPDLSHQNNLVLVGLDAEGRSLCESAF